MTTVSRDVAMRRPANQIAEWQPGSVGEVRQMLESATAEMKARQSTIRPSIDLAASNIVLAGALTGLALTANTAPELVFYPISASLAATAIAAVVLLRTPPRSTP